MIYNDHIQYNGHYVYGGIKEFYGGIMNSLKAETIKTTNKGVVDVKLSNKLVNPVTIEKPYYQRIFAGMPIGLLLTLTYPFDQDGELRT